MVEEEVDNLIDPTDEGRQYISTYQKLVKFIEPNNPVPFIRR